jgi:hypothetical protein
MKRPKPLTERDRKDLSRIARKLPRALAALLRPYVGFTSGVLIFDIQALIAALKSDDELMKALADLASRFGDDRVVDAAVELSDKLWQPEKPAPKRNGRPPEWTDADKLRAWLAVEAQWRADRKRAPDCTLASSIHQKFERLPRRGNGKWRVIHDAGARFELEKAPDGLRPKLVVGRARHRELTIETADNHYREGKAILEGINPAQRAILDRLADRWAQTIARKKPTR